jgi:hypothetical protein
MTDEERMEGEEQERQRTSDLPNVMARAGQSGPPQSRCRTSCPISTAKTQRHRPRRREVLPLDAAGALLAELMTFELGRPVYANQTGCDVSGLGSGSVPGRAARENERRLLPRYRKPVDPRRGPETEPEPAGDLRAFPRLDQQALHRR